MKMRCLPVSALGVVCFALLTLSSLAQVIPSGITGTVTGPNGVTPLENILVQAYRWNGSYWSYCSYGYSRLSDGCYEVGGLAAGTYRVAFRDVNGVYVGEVYDNIPGSDIYGTGTDIVVPESVTVSNINASLVVGSKITGTVTGPDGVTPLENIQVQTYRWNGSGWSWSSSGSSRMPGGCYEVGGLAAGTYRVAFSDWNGIYVGEVYDNIPGGGIYAAGTDIAVPALATVSNINASLDQYASLGGTVTEADGVTPVFGVRVRLIGTHNGIEWLTHADETGSYLFNSVLPAAYAVRVEPTTSSGYLGQWYGDALYVPGQDAPPPGAIVTTLTSGQSQTDRNFALDRAGRITGTVTGNGDIPIAGGHVRAKNGTYGLDYEGQTDAMGVYELRGLLPGNYTIKAEVDYFRDEWWSDATHEDFATAFPVASGDDLSFDFDLAPGQSPALIEVTSDPSGSAIYLDYQATTNVTPAMLNVGEIGDGDGDWAGCRIASHVITVKKAGRPRPVPQDVAAKEGETVNVHFDMTQSASGDVSVATGPDGATVYVDCADTAAGISPVSVGNLSPGSHVILLKMAGYLQPRPVMVGVSAGLTNEITVPLTTNTAPDQILADARSVPPGATIYVDYLPTPNVTDAVIGGMDPASHAGAGWHSASHTLMLRKAGTLPAAPRYVPDLTNAVPTMVVHLSGDPVTAVDEDHDGLPDQWEDAYRLRELAPGENGANDDPDQDGSSNSQEMRAGTNPRDGRSRVGVAGLTISTPGQGQTALSVSALDPGQMVTFILDTVPGRTYIVQCSADLTNKNGWVNLSGVIVATDYQIAYSTQIPEGTPHQFYRLVVLTP